jgi:endonuclease YncB( thermonuclease family)
MFHTLHRIVVLIFCGLLGLFGFYIYQHREIFNPLVDVGEAFLLRHENPPKIAAENSGKVVRVIDLSTVEVLSDDGKMYSVGLGGLVFPPANSTNKLHAQLRGDAKSRLEQLLLSNRVQVDFTVLSERRTGLGIVSVQQTNVNADLVEAGFASAKRAYLKGWTFKQLYTVIRSERRARTLGRGIWSNERQ